MTISTDDVRHVARLSRLAMDDAEIARMTDELGVIIDHIGKIRELPLSEVEPTTHAVEVPDPLADDVPHDGLSRDDALRNAPDPTDGFFRVPRMKS